jgi:glutaminyl-tRNA synthetase
VIDISLLEHCLRDDLNTRAKRVMGVLDPVRLVIENYPDGQVEQLDAVNNPEDESMGTRQVPFSRVLYIDRDDFMETPPPKFHRLYPGNEVRLRYAYIIKCTGLVKDPQTGAITEIRATYDPATRGGSTPDGRKIKGTIHWVSAAQAVKVEARLYDHLFTQADPEDQPKGKTFLDAMNPASLVVMRECLVEPSVASATLADRFQFERKGYFCLDARDSRPGALVFNETVSLRDSWAKIQSKDGR